MPAAIKMGEEEEEEDLIRTLFSAILRVSVSLLCVSERRRMFVPEEEKAVDAKASERE